MYLDGSTGKVGIGTTAPAEALHVVGNIIGGNNATNATRKYARYGAYHYTNAEEPFYALFVDANETQNYLRIGGGTGAGNASTSIFFYTAANTTTTDGTLALTIDGSQNATFAGTIGSGAITSTSSVKAEYHTLMDDSTVCGHLVREETITGAGSSRDVCLFAEGATDGGAIHFMTGGSVGKVLTLDASNNATFAGAINSGAITSTGAVIGTSFKSQTASANSSTSTAQIDNVSGHGLMFCRNTSGNNAYYYTYAFFKSSGNSPVGLVLISANPAGVSTGYSVSFSTGTYGNNYIRATHTQGDLTMYVLNIG